MTSDLPDPQDGTNFAFVNMNQEAFCSTGVIADAVVDLNGVMEPNPALTTALGSLQACQRLCNFESACRYFSFKQNGNCTRFDSGAGPCTQTMSMLGHALWMKNMTAMNSNGLNYFPAPQVHVTITKYGGSMASTARTQVKLYNKLDQNCTCESDTGNAFPAAFTNNNRKLEDCATDCAMAPGCEGFDWIPTAASATAGQCNVYAAMCTNATGRPMDIGQAFRLNAPVGQSISEAHVYSGSSFQYFSPNQVLALPLNDNHVCRPNVLGCSVHVQLDLNKGPPTRAPTSPPPTATTPTNAPPPTAPTPSSAPTAAPTSDGPYHSCSDVKIFSHSYDVTVSVTIQSEDAATLHISPATLRDRVLNAFTGTIVTADSIATPTTPASGQKGGSYQISLVIIDTITANSEAVGALISSKTTTELTNKLGLQITGISTSQKDFSTSSAHTVRTSMLALATGLLLAWM